ncbi:haloacid dehalogenase, type II [Pseudonocardia sp. Ae168_Ps1]|uniref:HAD family hydrolase n=1 Tax=unclassified Pseudonocardia TaxID=2619320 RepID=UPI00094AF887|nr:MULTISPECIES: HAD family hydrolase [unclassified Pseudonocardia]OLL74633.1 haloacid dehalogenase, type II [Pseudonocardia sp. Ae150A_Ps1]OLL80613.1 haloacid dehalogenase, type II [Pseudonocardia sp. Ae168_Ps1]OLL85259.1 haloacid dehalogenase, type II [Pseudonocardia sp. Ae263_Ps1]OLL94716.1 haloacid dehalogenase, type II [Pseudonocardia sp. Ae356_Ps1]
MIVTFDLFSALTDSRRGGSGAFAEIAGERDWTVTGQELYDEWDRHNKAGQKRVDTSAGWTSFRTLSRDALAGAYTGLGLTADPDADIDRVQRGVAGWPLWPDVADGLPAVAEHARIGILSNVDDALALTTRAHPLVDPGVVLTSERLGAYKPAPAVYLRARDLLGDGFVHVASSARDVRGAVEAGIRTVRLVRPGHSLDPDGPAPAVTVHDVAELAGVLAAMDHPA